MTDTSSGVFAYRLDGNGGGQEVGGTRRDEPGASDAILSAEGLLWLHLDHEDPATRRWFEEESGIDPVVYEALLADETRPRSFARRDGLLVILRGVNLNPGSDPEDMVSIRMWIEAHRVITLRHRRVIAVQEVREALDTGDGPTDAGEFLVEIADRLLTLMAPVLSEVDDQVDALEDQVLEAESFALRAKIGGLRRQTISLRRYLAPQRDAMARLQGERVSWLGDVHREHLRELGDRVTRYVEDLDSARPRGGRAGGAQQPPCGADEQDDVRPVDRRRNLPPPRPPHRPPGHQRRRHSRHREPGSLHRRLRPAPRGRPGPGVGLSPLQMDLGRS